MVYSKSVSQSCFTSVERRINQHQMMRVDRGWSQKVVVGWTLEKAIKSWRAVEIPHLPSY
jgi:hypothetical protein